MIRYSLLVAVLTLTAAAQPLRFGPAERVAPFTAGAPGYDYHGKVLPRVNGFTSYWLHAGELWSESLSGFPQRPELATAHSFGGFVLDYDETVNGPIVLDGEANGPSAFVRLIDEPQAQTTLHGFADAIECNSTRCLVSVDSGNTLAVVDTNAQLVKVLPPSPIARIRRAWATDPDGFLVVFENAAISIDNGGNVRADVKIDPFTSVATIFNGSRYAVFELSGAGVTAFTMTVDGQLSSTSIVSTSTMFPAVVGWNGSEYLLVGPPDLVGSIPEFVPANAISGLRVAPDLTLIDTRPIPIAPSIGANSPTSIAWSGGMFYVVWTHSGGTPLTVTNGTTVEGAAISPTGDVVARDLVSWGPLPQTSPRVARGTSSSIVVWSEIDVTSDAPALRYARNGNPITIGNGSAIDVVAVGDDYLVVWADGTSTRAAIVSADGGWSPVSLPSINSANAAVAANHDHWLLAGSIGTSLVTVSISRDGTASPPTVVAQLPFLYGLASDGDHFFLTSTRNFILDANGAPIAETPPHGAATHVDFAGGVYGAISGLGTLDRYDRDGNFIGSTTVTVPRGIPALSHIGSQFVVVDSSAMAIAKTDAPTSIAVETRPATDTSNRTTTAVFVESVSIVDTPFHRAVKH